MHIHKVRDKTITIIVLFCLLLSSFTYLPAFPAAAEPQEIPPSQITISNIKHNEVTISWLTSVNATGWVVWADEPEPPAWKWNRVNDLRGEEEVLGTGNNSNAYVLSTAFAPIVPNTLRIWEDGGQVVRDNGMGDLIGSGSGTVDYQLGSINVNFTSPVGSGQKIYATYLILDIIHYYNIDTVGGETYYFRIVSNGTEYGDDAMNGTMIGGAPWNFTTPRDDYPYQITVSNVFDDTFTVSWVTSVPTTGYINWSRAGQGLTSNATDVRGGVVDTTHYCTVSGVQSEKIYQFKIASNGYTYYQGPDGEAVLDTEGTGEPWSLTTFETETLPPSKIINGAAKRVDDTEFPNLHLIAYIKLASRLKSGDGTWDESMVLSDLTERVYQMECRYVRYPNGTLFKWKDKVDDSNYETKIMLSHHAGSDGYYPAPPDAWKDKGAITPGTPQSIDDTAAQTYQTMRLFKLKGTLLESDASNADNAIAYLKIRSDTTGAFSPLLTQFISSGSFGFDLKNLIDEKGAVFGAGINDTIYIRFDGGHDGTYPSEPLSWNTIFRLNETYDRDLGNFTLQTPIAPEVFTPHGVEITNVKANQFSVSWATYNLSAKIGRNITSYLLVDNNSDFSSPIRVYDDFSSGRFGMLHHCTVKYLEPSTQYYFKIVVGAGSWTTVYGQSGGVPTIDGDPWEIATFAPLGMPLNLEITEVMDVSARVSWQTISPVTGVLEYSDNPAFSISYRVNDTRGNESYTDTVHTCLIAGLDIGTRYYVRIISDGSTYTNSSWNLSTLSTGLHLPRATDISEGSFTVSWITDCKNKGYVLWASEPTPSEWNLAHDYRGADCLTSFHRCTVAGLQPGTIYYYRIGIGSYDYGNDTGNLSHAGQPWEVTTDTHQIGDIPQSYPVYGQLITDTGQGREGLVYCYVNSTTENSTMISAVTDSSGYFVPDLSRARNDTGKPWEASQGQQLHLEMFTQTANRSSIVDLTDTFPQDIGSFAYASYIIKGNLWEYMGVPPILMKATGLAHVHVPGYGNMTALTDNEGNFSMDLVGLRHELTGDVYEPDPGNAIELSLYSRRCFMWNLGAT